MKYVKKQNAILLLEDGTIFYGKSIGKSGTAFGELCFNTGTTGYQEIFTDPSYYGQIMVTTNAHIGNYGTELEEVESDSIKIAGLVCRNFSFNYSRVAASQSLEDFLNANNLFAISDVDTRALVSYIRENGAMNAVMTTEIDDIEGLKKKLSQVPNMKGLELASKVSTKEPYYFGNPDAKFRVAALDLGIKKNILRNMAKRDVYIKVFPFDSTFEEMQEFNPDGYFISNGPGDPEPLKDAQKLASKVLEHDIPLFGICLGHQIIALSRGISTFKMHHGHRGINHPIKNIETTKGEITSQNHGFAVNREEAEKHPEVEVTHTHLNDHTLAGMRIKGKNCFSVQYHPEAGPGPSDASYLFDQFISLIEQAQLKEA